jgi:hypothetical protein
MLYANTSCLTYVYMLNFPKLRFERWFNNYNFHFSYYVNIKPFLTFRILLYKILLYFSKLSFHVIWIFFYQIWNLPSNFKNFFCIIDIRYFLWYILQVISSHLWFVFWFCFYFSHHVFLKYISQVKYINILVHPNLGT